jgi:DNA-binding MarR family transcriptional regulator
MTAAGLHIQPRTNLTIGFEQSVELSVQSCLDNMGISRLSEWDVLAFIYRHGVSLTSISRIAHLVGYDITVVAEALDRLERERLIDCSRPSQEVRFYRLRSSTDSVHKYYLQQLIGLSEDRVGRLLLVKRLKTVRQESGR